MLWPLPSYAWDSPSGGHTQLRDMSPPRPGMEMLPQSHFLRAPELLEFSALWECPLGVCLQGWVGWAEIGLPFLTHRMESKNIIPQPRGGILIRHVAWHPQETLGVSGKTERGPTSARHQGDLGTRGILAGGVQGSSDLLPRTFCISPLESVLGPWFRTPP